MSNTLSNQLFHKTATPLLEQSITLTSQLIEILEKENSILKTTDTSSLESLAGEKELVTTTLDKLNQDWLAITEQQVKELSTDRINRFLKFYDKKHETELFNQWKSLQSLARKCQRLNTINGSILSLRNHAANQILSILRGQSDENKTYDTHGNSKSVYGAGHSLAKA